MGDADAPLGYRVRPIHCSFCDKPARDVAKMVAGPGVHICNECIVLCFAILCEETPHRSTTVRFAVRRADGSKGELEVERVPDSQGTFTPVEQCLRCGTWNSGYDISECLHCGAPLGKGATATAAPQDE